ncbi:MAG: metallophosphoesterase [Oligoflexia bacterium]
MRTLYRNFLSNRFAAAYLASLAFLTPIALSMTPAFAAPALRVLIYGDAGTGQQPQLEVGQAMATRHAQAPFHFALSLGDNWYREDDTQDPEALKRIFDTPYAGLISTGLVMYQTLGNHDHRAGHMERELEYSKTHPSFKLPARDYVVLKPELKIIVIDVLTESSKVDLPPERMAFLEKELCAKDPQPWKALALHSHVFNTGPRGDNEDLKKALLPLLSRCAPDFVFSGHEHHAEFMKPMGQTWFVISGNGGAEDREGRGKSERPSEFFSREHGFAELQLTSKDAKLVFYNTELRVLLERTRKR